MPKFSESTLIEASAEEVWALFPDFPDIGHEFLGVERIDLQPTEQPFGVDSRLHISISKFSRVVVARIIDIDDQAFAFQAEVSGPGVSGEITNQLHPVSANQSRLAVDGDLRGNLLTSPLIGLGLVVFKREGVHQIGQTLSKHAIARRDRTN